MARSNLKPQMTPEQQTMFKQAVAQKALDPVPYEEYCAITPEQADAKFQELQGKVDFSQPLPDRPRTQESPERKLSNELATDPQLEEMERLVKAGYLFPMKSETFFSQTKSQASEKISIGRNNEKDGIKVEGYDPNYVSKRDQPMDSEQEAEINRLVADKRLNPLTDKQKENLTQGGAGKLIFVGRKREEENSLAPEFEPAKPQDKSPSKPKSPADDIPM